MPFRGGGGGDLKQTFALSEKAAGSSDVRDCIDQEYLSVTLGLITASEVANYIEKYGTAAWWAQKFRYMGDSFAASVMVSANLSGGKAASILNDSEILVSKAASILGHANMTAAGAARIIDSSNLAVSKAKDILCDSGIAADKTASILHAMTVQTRLLDLLTYGASDVTYSSNTNISGVNRYGSLTVNSAVILTVTGQPGAILAKTVSNSGTVTKSTTGGAGGTSGCGGVGGQGGGGFSLFCNGYSGAGTIAANGAAGGNGGTTSTYQAGGSGGAGALFRPDGSSQPGTGGNGGYLTNGTQGYGDKNGAGGGGFNATYLGGNGVAVTYTDHGSYALLAQRIIYGFDDWVVQNPWARSLTSPYSVPDVKGSGGGGGACYDAQGADGGGGGGGGEVLIVGLTWNCTGTVTANAGNGGNWGSEGTADVDGGGGGGGFVFVMYKTLTNLGTLQAALGTRGGNSDSYPATNGTAGVTGSSAF